MTRSLQGRRVLLVDDESAVRFLIEDMLLELGAGTVDAAASLEEAERLVATGNRPDFAVLDLHLSGRTSYPLAAQLKALGVPFLFATGYGATSHPEGWSGTPTLVKPFQLDLLSKTVAEIMDALP